MEFRDELRAAAEECVKKQHNTADHLIRQAFFDGVSWYMAFLRQQNKKSPTPPSES